MTRKDKRRQRLLRLRHEYDVLPRERQEQRENVAGLQREKPFGAVRVSKHPGRIAWGGRKHTNKNGNTFRGIRRNDRHLYSTGESAA